MIFSQPTIQRLTFGLIFSVIGFSAVAEDRVVATMNGVDYTESALRLRLAPLLEQPHYSLEAQYPQLLEQFLLEELTFQNAQKAGYADDPRVKEQIKRATFSFLNRYYFEDQLEKMVTDESVVAEYDARMGNSESMQEIHARHILVASKDKAKEIIALLDDGGDFAKLAKEHSTGPSSSEGGDLGYFTKGQMVPEFEAAAFALEKGQYTKEPVKTQFGYHIILQEDSREAEKPSFASVRQEILQELKLKAAHDFVQEIKATADIQRYDLNGNPLASSD